MNPEKVAIRKHVRALRDAALAEQHAAWTALICTKALALPAYQAAYTIHIFLSFQSEVDTRAIIEHALAHGKRVVVPVFVKDSDETPCTQITSLDNDAFHFGKWNMRTPKVLRPVPLDEIDLVFAPMVAFATPPLLPSPKGEGLGMGWPRIGYGAGYYDRFLARLRPGVPKIGLAFGMQRVASIPVEPHDVVLDDMLTEQS
jgi:5-formyltetrahydrofolate cyclo-ligase